MCWPAADLAGPQQYCEEAQSIGPTCRKPIGNGLGIRGSSLGPVKQGTGPRRWRALGAGTRFTLHLGSGRLAQPPGPGACVGSQADIQVVGAFLVEDGLPHPRALPADPAAWFCGPQRGPESAGEAARTAPLCTLNLAPPPGCTPQLTQLSHVHSWKLRLVSDASPAAPTSQMTPGQPGSLSCQQQGVAALWYVETGLRPGPGHRVSVSLVTS